MVSGGLMGRLVWLGLTVVVWFAVGSVDGGFDWVVVLWFGTGGVDGGVDWVQLGGDAIGWWLVAGL